MSFRFPVFAVVATAALLGGLSAHAGSVNGASPVTAAVAASCVLDTSASDISGNVTETRIGVQAPLGTSHVSLHCTGGTTAMLTANLGKNPPTALGASCSSPIRGLKGGNGSGNDTMYYTLSFQPEGDGFSSALGCDGPNNGFVRSSSSINSEVGGTLSSNVVTADVPAGVYTDQVILTASF